MKKILVLDGAFTTSVNSLFRAYGFDVVQSMRSPNIDAVVFTGGEDIDPGIYGETKMQCTYSSPRRDAFEKSVYETFSDLPKIGICRGAQFLNVMAGGSMWQDTDGHESAHFSKVKDGRRLWTSSLHHQMMKPTSRAEVIMVADESSYVVDPSVLVYKDDQPYDDIEVVYYPETKALCYQGHPEIGDKDEKEFFQTLLFNYLQLG